MTNWLIKTFIRDANAPNTACGRMLYGKLSGWVGIICNFLLFTGKFIAGSVSGSVSIMADAVNNLSDASSSIISLLASNCLPVRQMRNTPLDTDVTNTSPD